MTKNTKTPQSGLANKKKGKKTTKKVVTNKKSNIMEQMDMEMQIQ